MQICIVLSSRSSKGCQKKRLHRRHCFIVALLFLSCFSFSEEAESFVAAKVEVEVEVEVELEEAAFAVVDAEPEPEPEPEPRQDPRRVSQDFCFSLSLSWS